MSRKCLVIAFTAVLFLPNLSFAKPAGETDFPVITHLTAEPTFSVSTNPGNGDQNPYGVAFVPNGFPRNGKLKPGDILVSNFNNSTNLQGTGTTIVSVDQTGKASPFFEGQTGLGLSTALGVLRSGFVIVGNFPSTNGQGVCTETGGQETGVEQGALIILDRDGNVVTTLASEKFLNGPWDMTIRDEGNRAQLFVSNAISGTVSRIDLRIHEGESKNGPITVESEVQIGSGYMHHCDPTAFVIGPTGLALDTENDTLFVASTGDNTIFAIRNASMTNKDGGTGKMFVSDSVHMHGPLGLAMSRDGHLLSAQGDSVNPDAQHFSEIVEYDEKGEFVGEFQVDTASGSAFGLALELHNGGFVFGAVDDGLGTLDVWVVK